MVNRVSTYFPKGGHSGTQTELKIIMITRKVKRHRNADNKNRQQRFTTKQPPRIGLLQLQTPELFVCLFDLMLYVHGKQLRSCWDGQLLNHIVPGQASRGSSPVLSALSFVSN